jgi:hypothetical protein
MLTDAQQEFINQAIAQTRCQTLAENAISRDDERSYYEKKLQEMARQAKRDLPDSLTSSSVENPRHAFETPKVQQPTKRDLSTNQ